LPPAYLKAFRWASSIEFAVNDFAEETLDVTAMPLFFPLITPKSLQTLTCVSNTLFLSEFNTGFISRSENEFLSVLLELAPLLSSSI
jgi:hypothetical protein